jgi:hypothetical protein
MTSIVVAAKLLLFRLERLGISCTTQEQFQPFAGRERLGTLKTVSPLRLCHLQSSRQLGNWVRQTCRDAQVRIGVGKSTYHHRAGNRHILR